MSDDLIINPAHIGVDPSTLPDMSMDGAPIDKSAVIHNIVEIPIEADTMRYLIMRHSLINDYLHGVGHGDDRLTCTDVYSIYDIACVKISSTLYNTYRPQWHGKAIEIDEETAKYGAAFFSEIRPVAKLWEASQDHYAGIKKPVEITPEIVKMVLTFMHAFAKMIVEAEYDRRFHEMIDTSEVERESWHIQKLEAKEFLKDPNLPTPFIDYIAESHGWTKMDLVKKIAHKAEQHHLQIATMLVDMQKVLKQFKNCSTIWDMNILYENYLGVMMPTNQAIELGLCVSETDWTRKVAVKVHEFGF
jgi:hypothetical protein